MNFFSPVSEHMEFILDVGMEEKWSGMDQNQGCCGFIEQISNREAKPGFPRLSHFSAFMATRQQRFQTQLKRSEKTRKTGTERKEERRNLRRRNSTTVLLPLPLNLRLVKVIKILLK